MKQKQIKIRLQKILDRLKDPEADDVMYQTTEDLEMLIEDMN